ncbi:hypothetical protein M0R45_028334 [Rubus argutus]|uniref:DNA excision repair protein ERCC-1 n=1 Tax=Rubus argutus TaxID=59490 RepID=A0AAW1W921_RUBAR
MEEEDRVQNTESSPKRNNNKTLLPLSNPLSSTLPPPPSTTPLKPQQASETPNSREAGQSDVPSSSAPTNAVASSSSAQRRNAILVSHRQKGNPLLKHIRNVRWEFADIICDYLLGQSSCALYLSLRYHLLHPDYLYYRIRELQKNYKLRVVLCHVDVEDVVKPLLEVTKTAMLHECTLLCAWSLEEYYLSRLNHALTTVRHVNKTDVVTLGTTFGSLSHVMDVSMEDLARCPGIGERKVKRLYETFHEPFKRVVASRPAASESTVPDNAGPCSVTEDKEMKETEEESKRRKKEQEPTNSKSPLMKNGDTSVAKEAEAGKGNS